MKNLRENTIEPGDLVHVNFNGSQYSLCSRALVLNRPGQTGESWVFKDQSTQKIHYVSEGCTVTKIQQADEDVPS